MNTAFSTDLLKLLSNVNESVVISPISISTSLAITMLGARKETSNQIKNVIGKDFGTDEIHEYFSNILAFLKTDADINFVNQIYFAEDLKILESYREATAHFYDSCFEMMDFVDNDKAANKINHFVANVTNHTIENLVTADMFDPDIQMVIVNAIYFNKNWLFPFQLSPSKSIFYGSPDLEIHAHFLSNKAEYRYLKTANYQAVQLPYTDPKFSMIIILPIEKIGLSVVLQNIDMAEILNKICNSPKQLGCIFVPKFKATSFFTLPISLKKMGIIDAFDSLKADFSGINKNKKLFVSNIVHQAFIQIDEKGTKAGAATSVFIKKMSSVIEKEFEFLADHPFLYLVVDQKHNIYFIGTLNKIS